MSSRNHTPGRIAGLVAFAADRRANPGEWAPHPRRITAVESAASRIRNGQTAVFGTGFQARVTGDTLHVRYAPQPTA